MNTFEILIVEDNDGDALIFEELFDDARFGPGGEDQIVFRRARSIAEATDTLLDDGTPDCVLLDLGLPDSSGTEGVAAVTRCSPDVPIVVLTGSDDPEFAREALAGGAQDFLVKGSGLTTDGALRALRYAADRAAQRRALRVSRAELRTFAHQVAHDLKSPLVSVLGFLELVQRRASGEDAELLGVALGSAKRLGEMVDRLLEFAETAGEDGMIASVDLEAAVDWTLDVLSDRLADATVTVRRPLPDVHANSTAVQHVLLNVLSNAEKYADQARPLEVVIDAERRAGMIRITVDDNGRGVDSALRRKVFEDGERIHDDVEGTGLGLSSARRTLQLFGGTIALADGRDGVGVSAIIELPATRD